MSDKILSLRPNRESLIRHLDAYLERERAGDQVLALLVVEVKRGRELGALFGFRNVEALMKKLGERLDGACRSRDRILRTGDYEYALILPELSNEGHAILAANKILRSLSAPFEVGVQAISAGASMGIALFPDQAHTPDDLLQRAEQARADAERRGVAYALYTPEAPGQLAAEWDIESELDAALENGELEVFYQPKVRVRGGLPSGAEALVRWRSPKRGLVPPDKFIPVAMQSGQIGTLTWSVLNMALQQAHDWPTRFGPLSVAVNLAPSLLEDPLLVNRVIDAMNVWGTRPGRLVLEVTESAMLRNPEVSLDAIRVLKEAGVPVSIDDFGTGYSSLANFRDMPAAELKIDKGFVMGMLDHKPDANIVRAVLELARTFHLPVVAEGVENLAILKALARLHCDYAQGYYFSKPLPAADFVKFIESYTPPAL
ncbi:MAG: putative bifunctional diguanylate cyclase/phosphodiesterase [Gammaproteobacteria bacterium]